MAPTELPHEVDLELAHVLVGIRRRTVGAQRSLSLGTDISTVTSCDVLNGAVRAVSGMGAKWDDEMTWKLIQEEIYGATQSDERDALIALLALGDYKNVPQKERRVAAISALRLTGSVTPASIRIKYQKLSASFDSAVLLRTVPVLRALIQDALAPNRLQSRARSLMAFVPPTQSLQQLNVQSALRRLGSAPTRYAHYPTRLTTQVLVAQLAIYEPSPVPEPTADRIPVLPAPIEERSVADLDDALEEPGIRAVLTAGPGYGKSTFVRGVAMLRLQRGLPTLLVSAAALAERASQHDAPNLSTAIALIVEECQASLGLAFAEEGKIFPEHIVDDSGLCLLVDGIDEVPEGMRLVFDDVIEELSAIAGSILVTTRPGTRLPSLSEWQSLQMAPFSSAAAFIDLWFEGKYDHPGYAQAVATLDDPEYKRIHDSPLLVGFIAQVSELQRHFTSVSDLYDEYVVLSLERSWKGSNGAAFDDALIYRLKSIARTIAWKMALGESRSPNEASGWRGQATLAQILGLVPEPDHALVVTLLKVEALFVVAVEGASRLHTTYAWAHRTIQEHLVGAQVREELRVPGGIEQLVALSTDRNGWTTSLVHAVSEFDDDERVRTLQALAEVEGPRIDQLLAAELSQRIVMSSPEDSAAWQWHADSIWQSNPDSAIGTANIEVGSAEALLACVRAVRPDSAEFIKIIRGNDGARLAHLIDDVAAAIRSGSAAPDWMHATMFLAQSETSPLEAFRNYFEALRGGLKFSLLYPGDNILSLSEVEVLKDELDGLSWPEPRWKAVTTLLRSGADGTRDLILARPNGADEVALAELMLRLEHIEPTDADTSVASVFDEASDTLPLFVVRALGGEFGEYVSYSVAKQLPLADNKKLSGGTSLWAGVAFLEQSFAAGNFFEAPDQSVDHLAVVRSFNASWLSDPRKMIEYLQSQHQLQRSLRLIASEELLYSQLRVHLETDRLGSKFGEPIFTVESLDAMIAAHFRRLGFDLFVYNLLATQARDWLPLGGKIPALMAMWGEGVGQMAASDEGSPAALQQFFEDERFRRVVNWGVRGDLPILTSLDDTPHHMKIQLERLLENVDPRLLEIPGNLDWLDEQQARIHGLHEWKARRGSWLTIMRERSGARSRG